MTKSNAAFQKLSSHFEDMEEKYKDEVKKNKDRPTPVDDLRNLIPNMSEPDGRRSGPFEPDPDLVLRSWDPERFDEFCEEEKEIMRRFH